VGNGKSSVVAFLVPVAIVVAALVVTDRRAESSDMDRVGRFQIAAGCYLASVGEGVVEKDDILERSCAMFKIDTVTGETWVFRERVKTQSILADEFERRWEPID